MPVKETTRDVSIDKEAHKLLMKLIKKLFPEGIDRIGSEVNKAFYDPVVVSEEEVDALKTILGLLIENKIWLNVEEESMVNYGEISYFVLPKSGYKSGSAPSYLLKLKEDRTFSITTYTLV